MLWEANINEFLLFTGPAEILVMPLEPWTRQVMILAAPV